MAHRTPGMLRIGQGIEAERSQEEVGAANPEATPLGTAHRAALEPDFNALNEIAPPASEIGTFAVE